MSNNKIKTLNMTRILKSYNKNPAEYIENLESTIRSANILMELLKITNNDQNLKQLITEYAYVNPEQIIESDYSLDDRINLIKIVYLDGKLGAGDIITYYTDIYNIEQINDNFDLNSHCVLLQKLISKISLDAANTDPKWKIQSIVQVEAVILDCANNTISIDNSKLVGLLPLYYVLENIEPLVWTDAHQRQFKSLIRSLDIISEHLYGPKKENILDIARILNVMNDQHYWISGLNIKDPQNIDHHPLPEFN